MVWKRAGLEIVAIDQHEVRDLTGRFRMAENFRQQQTQHRLRSGRHDLGNGPGGKCRGIGKPEAGFFRNRLLKPRGMGLREFLPQEKTQILDARRRHGGRFSPLELLFKGTFYFAWYSRLPLQTQVSE